LLFRPIPIGGKSLLMPVIAEPLEDTTERSMRRSCVHPRSLVTSRQHDGDLVATIFWAELHNDAEPSSGTRFDFSGQR
jgi:hypothetical protein